MVKSDPMQLYEWNAVEREQLNPSFARQVIHGDSMTVARVYLKKGYTVPEHSHANEQISMMEQGSYPIRTGRRARHCESG